MLLLAVLALAPDPTWIMVVDDPGVTVYLGTEGTEIDHNRRTYKTWVRFTYHNVPAGESNEAMTLDTFNCADGTVQTSTMIESYRNAAAKVTHPNDGPQKIPPSTYYQSVKDAVCYIMKTGE